VIEAESIEIAGAGGKNSSATLLGYDHRASSVLLKVVLRSAAAARARRFDRASESATR